MKYACYFLLFIPHIALAQSLEELYQAARKNVATLQQREYEVEIAKQEKWLTRSGSLPQLSFNYIERKQDDKGLSAFESDKQTTSVFTLSQSLFEGGSEYYAFGIAKRLPKIAELEKYQAEIDLFQSVAAAFYRVLQLQKTAEILKEQEKTLEQQVRTIQQRANIGRSKATDVLASRSQLARVTAELAQVESQLEQAKLELRSQTGVEKIEKLSDASDPLNMFVPPDWEHGLLQSPQIQANELLLEVSKKQIGVARGSLLPSLDVEADYFLERTGQFNEAEWVITLNANWELFSGGGNYAQKNIRDYEARIVAAQLGDLRRNIQYRFDSLKKEFQLQKDSIKKLDVAVKLAKQNYQEHLKEVNRGLVSQLDVLRVLQDYQQIRRSYEQQKYETKLTYIRLKSVAGVRP